MGNKLAELIKNAREAKNISQRELSRQTGIDNNTISQIEKGERKKPNSLSLIKLSKALDLSLESLMEASGYSLGEINMAYSTNSEDDVISKPMYNVGDYMKHIEGQIIKVENLINQLNNSKKNHDDPAYKNMTKEDIKFFDEQTDELIKMNQDILKIYKKRYNVLKNIDKND